jgi:hypothetical protein
MSATNISLDFHEIIFENLYTKLSNKQQSIENRLGDSHILLKWMSEILSQFPHFWKYLSEIWQNISQHYIKQSWPQRQLESLNITDLLWHDVNVKFRENSSIYSQFKRT